MITTTTFTSDNMDRRLFGAYTEAWLTPQTLHPSFTFNPEHPINRITGNFSYRIPKAHDVNEYLNFINKVITWTYFSSSNHALFTIMSLIFANAMHPFCTTNLSTFFHHIHNPSFRSRISIHPKFLVYIPMLI